MRPEQRVKRQKPHREPRRVTRAAILAAAVVLPAVAGADTFRCAGSIIDTGLVAAEVLAKCGDPDSREVFEEPVRAARVNGGTHVVGTVIIEHWVYDRGFGRFPAHLTFEEDRLTRIELLDRK